MKNGPSIAYEAAVKLLPATMQIKCNIVIPKQDRVGIDSVVPISREEVLFMMKRAEEIQILAYPPYIQIQYGAGKLRIPAVLPLSAPKLLTPQVRRFCFELNKYSNPVYLNFEMLSPNAEPKICHTNVEEYAKVAGGKVQRGWTIYELPNYFLEAEYHSVWADQDGTLHDITPKEDGVCKILFLGDDSLDHEVLQRSILQPLNRNEERFLRRKNNPLKIVRAAW